MEETLLSPLENYTMPERETPARRLAEHPADYLSDAELLSLLVGGSLGPVRSLRVARDLLAAYGSFRRITTLTLTELQRFPGIGMSRACSIRGAVEFSRRLQRPTRVVIVETKGREDLDVPKKMERLKQWCEDVNKIQADTTYDFVFVDYEGFEKYPPKSFKELMAGFKEYK